MATTRRRIIMKGRLKLGQEKSVESIIDLKMAYTCVGTFCGLKRIKREGNVLLVTMDRPLNVSERCGGRFEASSLTNAKRNNQKDEEKERSDSHGTTWMPKGERSI